jgi:hypothetical protein
MPSKVLALKLTYLPFSLTYLRLIAKNWVLILNKIHHNQPAYNNKIKSPAIYYGGIGTRNRRITLGLC